MSLVKLLQEGNVIYVNPDHVGIVSPHATLVNRTNVTLALGLNIQVEGAASELALKLGYSSPLLSE
jgi:hypothetical protein